MITESYIEGVQRRCHKLLEDGIHLLQTEKLDLKFINYISEVTNLCGYLSALTRKDKEDERKI